MAFTNLRTASLSVSLCVLALLAGSASPARAYCYRTCDGNKIKWDGNGTTVYFNHISFPAGAVRTSDGFRAAGAWTDLPKCSFTYTRYIETDDTVSNGNGVNEVYFYGIDGPGGTLAKTLTLYRCDIFDEYIAEADIRFDDAEAWSFGSVSYTGSGVSLRLVALHEFGHALGLCHENRVLETMNSYYPNGGTIGHARYADPHADARAGARSLYYQSGPAVLDVALSNYKRTGAGGAGLIAQPYSAQRGSNVTLETTFENLGTMSATATARWYLSANDYITTSDTPIGSGALGGSPGHVGTVAITLHIPSNIAKGSWYIGTLIDPDNVLNESDEHNNSLEAPYPVTIY